MDENVARLRQASRDVVRELGIIRDGHGPSHATPSQCHALIEISLAGGLTITELAGKLLIDKSAASRLVATLTTRGWVQATVRKEDRRRRVIALTQKGRTRLKAIDDAASSRVSETLTQLDDAAVDTIVRGMSLYGRALRRARLRGHFSIRRIRKADDPAVAQIIRSVMTEYGAVGAGYSIQDAEVDTMHSTYTTPRSAFLVLERQSTVVGGGGVAPLAGGSEEICELRKMYLLRDARGLGFGQTMLSRILDEARQIGYRTCYLETLDRMHEARALYEKNGFRPLDRALGCTGHTACNVWYSLEL